jgi:hypothetical protein
MLRAHGASEPKVVTAQFAFYVEAQLAAIIR